MHATPTLNAVKKPKNATARLPVTALRQAGACLHIASLPGPHGIGEIGRDARAFIDQLVAAGLGVWQFLPTGPTAYGDSPYQPLSTYAGNTMLIELRELVDLGLLEQTEIDTLCTLPSDYVDYGPLISQKTKLLETAAARFSEHGGALKTEFERFLANCDAHWLHDYALFRVLKSLHNDRSWSQWEPRYAKRDPAALAKIGKSHADGLFAVKFAQFLFDRQWRALHDYAKQNSITLFGDMPIYIALDSADAWSNGRMLRLDEDGKPSHVAGVPPDYFSADGQLWGNPLYDWDYHASSNYAWWVGRMRHAMSMLDLVRIDHFRGFEAYWAVPFEASTARVGQWEPGPNDAVFDAMRAALGELPIVAEDLGEITPAVDELRLRQQMPGMSVLQFLAGESGFKIDDVGVDSVCYTGTHDNDTTMGWFNGGPGDIRTPEQIQSMQEAVISHTGGKRESIHWDLIGLAFASAACLAIVPMQDFLGLGSEARLNTPGSSANNWRWRLPASAFDETLASKIHALARAGART